MDTWQIGESQLSPIQHLQDTLTVSHTVGVNIDSVTVQLFDYGCETPQPQFSPTASVSIENDHLDTSTSLANYDVFFQPDLFENDSGGFVSFDDESSGSVDFCVRVFSNIEHMDNNGVLKEVPVNFLDTNFKFVFETKQDLKSHHNNGLERHLIRVDAENTARSRRLDDTVVNGVEGCQCKDYTCQNSVVGKNSPLVFCLTPIFPEGDDYVIENYSLRVTETDGMEVFMLVSIDPDGFASPGPTATLSYNEDNLVNMVSSPLPDSMRKSLPVNVEVNGMAWLKNVDTGDIEIVKFDEKIVELSGECSLFDDVDPSRIIKRLIGSP